MKRYDVEEVTDADGTYTPDMEECIDGGYVLYDDVIAVLSKVVQNGDVDKEGTHIILDFLISDK